MRRGRGLLLAALAAALLAGPTAESVAKKHKARLTARVDGKKFKGSKRGTFFIYAPTGFSVISQTKVKRGVSRAINVSCGQIDLRTVAVPIGPLQCYGFYQVNVVRGPGSQTTWISQGTELTITSFDGVSAVGSFRGVVGPSASSPGEAPVTIENGSFFAFVLDNGV
jgi:hypothetical protein